MRTVSRVAAVLLSVFLIWNLVVYFRNKDTQEPAVRGTIKEQISANAWLIKSETLVAAPADGVLQPYISDCEKAGRNMSVAAILSGETDEAARVRLTVVKNRISSLKDALQNSDYENDLIGLDDSLDTNISRIIKTSSQGKMTNISSYKNDIVKLLDKRVAASGGGDALLASLDSERKTLESKLGNLINEIYTPVSGVFSARLDGFEEVFTPASIDWLLPSDIENKKNVRGNTQSRVSRGENVCKIIDNFEWYLAAVLDARETDGFKKGNIVRVSFLDSGGEVAKAEIYRVSDEENGKKLVVLRVSRDLGGILSKRQVKIDIILHTYEGLKVPTAALCVENDVTGVYVQNGNDRAFKPVDVLYHNNDYMIIKEDNTKENVLLLYDNVIVKGEAGR